MSIDGRSHTTNTDRCIQRERIIEKLNPKAKKVVDWVQSYIKLLSPRLPK